MAATTHCEADEASQAVRTTVRTCGAERAGAASSLVLVGSRLPRVRSVCALVWSAGLHQGCVCQRAKWHHGAERPIHTNGRSTWISDQPKRSKMGAGSRAALALSAGLACSLPVALWLLARRALEYVAYKRRRSLRGASVVVARAARVLLGGCMLGLPTMRGLRDYRRPFSTVSADHLSMLSVHLCE